MKVLFRADASVQLGSGHVMRCLTLADELALRGHRVAFACLSQAGDMQQFIAGKGFEVVSLSGMADDAGEMADAMAAWGGADWLAVDHYGLAAEWEKPLYGRVRQIFVLDDSANRRHVCDLLLDQNLYRHPEDRYLGLVPEGCRLLLGPDFALLRAEFHRARNATCIRSAPARRLLVSFGGSDPTNETEKVLEALSLAGIAFERVDVVLGSANPMREILPEIHGGREGIVFHVQAENMAELMSLADLSLGGGGVTTWERSCIGLPTLCIAVAENQVAIAEEAHRAGLLHYLGWHEEVSVVDVANALKEWVFDGARLAAMSGCGRRYVDGLGTARVCDVMESMA